MLINATTHLPAAGEVLGDHAGTLYRTDGFCSDTMFIPGRDRNGTDYTGEMPVTQLWTVVDGILVAVIVFGNALTIVAVRTNRKLTGVLSNQFILNLATSDFMLGLTLPYHTAFYICGGLGHHKTTCLLRFSLIALMCTSSVFNLIAIAVDRYVAIVHPLHYCRYMTDWSVHALILVGWCLAFAVGTVPLYWNTWDEAVVCELDEVLHPYYLAAVLLPAFGLIWLAMFAFYVRIWREARGQARRMPGSGSDRKSVQVVLLILGCFSVCWLPFFIVAVSRVFGALRTPQAVLVYKAAFSLAMANSGMNPVIYAWKNSEFKRTFARLLRCRYADGRREEARSCKSGVDNEGRVSEVPRELVLAPPDVRIGKCERRMET